ncbi:hypothetical protein ACFWHR_03825 [Leucobacter sp. NPDC058333]|uniref:hypothetical protein n=1 Tax=Leucobacter sp. NPDC058333 TaxID=3346450 RepID=UPI003660B617
MTPQTTRTFIAALVGVLIVRLVALVPVVAGVIAWADGVFAEAGYGGTSTLALIQAAITAAAVLLYQKIAQWLGDRWPNIEKWMLGNSARPHYEPRYAKING